MVRYHFISFLTDQLLRRWKGCGTSKHLLNTKNLPFVLRTVLALSLFHLPKAEGPQGLEKIGNWFKGTNGKELERKGILPPHPQPCLCFLSPVLPDTLSYPFCVGCKADGHCVSERAQPRCQKTQGRILASSPGSLLLLPARGSRKDLSYFSE